MSKNCDYQSICSLIILYQPDLNKINQCINSLSSQVNEIFIIDNSKNNYKIFHK